MSFLKEEIQHEKDASSEVPSSKLFKVGLF